MKPQVSILLPVRNGESYIKYAIESVMNQTFSNFELVIIDNGSTDKTKDAILSFSDKRIKYHFSNSDFITSLNRGIDLCEGKYIARMDADDYMHYDRIRTQFLLLENVTFIDVCGCWMSSFDDMTKILNRGKGFLGNLQYALLFGNIVYHPTVMWRKQVFKDNGLFYKNYLHSEDYRLWVDAALTGLNFYIIPQPLHYYRIHSGQITIREREKQIETSKQIKEELIRIIVDREENNVLKGYFQSVYQLYKTGHIDIIHVAKSICAIKQVR